MNKTWQMFENKYVGLSLFCLVFLGILSSCADHKFPLVAEYLPENISCEDKSTLKQKEKTASWLRNPDGDLYVMSHYKSILENERNAANSGNPLSMLFYGDIKREILYLTSRGNPENLVYVSDDEYFYSDKIREDVIDALTYIYLSSIIESEKRNNVISLAKRVEMNHSDIKIPKVWIAKAKENAQRWKEYCGK
jgi:hypothetical protein